MINKLEEYSKLDINNYKIIICGLINGILFEPYKYKEYMQYLFVINKDNFDFFIYTIVSVK
jgi:hypothetical protein